MNLYQNTSSFHGNNEISTTSNGYKNRLNVNYYNNMADKKDLFNNKQQNVSNALLNQINTFSRLADNNDKEIRKENFNKKLKFRLKTNDEVFEYKPEEKNFTYYQICHFDINKYHSVRKLVYDQYLNVIKTKVDKVKKSKLKRFIKNTKDNKYVLYPTYDLENVKYPSDEEILQASSQILNGNVSCYY